MAGFLQSQQRGVSRSRAPQQNWLLASLCSYREDLELGPLFPLLLGPNPLPGEPEIGPCSQPGRCPLGLSLLQVSAQSLPGSLLQSLLHAHRVHRPGLVACRRGLGHRLQLLLGLPDVMELLELLHHVVFEVRV